MTLRPGLWPHAVFQRHPRHRVECLPRSRIAIGSAVRLTAAALHVNCWPRKKCRQGSGRLPCVDATTRRWEMRVWTHSSARTR